jgi:hypothetical protein
MSASETRHFSMGDFDQPASTRKGKLRLETFLVVRCNVQGDMTVERQSLWQPTYILSSPLDSFAFTANYTTSKLRIGQQLHTVTETKGEFLIT